MASLKESEINQLIEDFNKRVNEAHFAHYKTSPYGLVDNTEKQSPNENVIYHLYNDGEITHQKGSWAYLKRSEFPNNVKDEIIITAKKLRNQFVFPKKIEKDVGLSYAILTKEECHKFNMEMKDILENIYSLTGIREYNVLMYNKIF